MLTRRIGAAFDAAAACMQRLPERAESFGPTTAERRALERLGKALAEADAVLAGRDRPLSSSVGRCP